MIMSRRAEDDLEALLISTGMNKAGADVFSVTFNGTGKYAGAIDTHSRFIVWAKIKDEKHLKIVDNYINREFKTRGL